MASGSYFVINRLQSSSNSSSQTTQEEHIIVIAANILQQAHNVILMHYVSLKEEGKWVTESQLKYK